MSGYDEYGRFQHEVIVLKDERASISKYSYVVIGHYLPEDFIPKIGEWFWS